VFVKIPDTRYSYILLHICICFIASGCASRIPTLSQSPGCETSVEGYYHCNDPWSKAKPAIIIRQGMQMKIITGAIVSMDAVGVTFDPSGEGQVRDPKPEYFRFDKIETLIGEDGTVLHGSIPEEYSRAYILDLHLIPVDASGSKKITLSLKPNARFGLCVPPGVYVVSGIRFRNDFQKMVDAGVEYPRLTVPVTENRANYIGDLYIDCNDAPQQDLIIIPYKIEHRPSTVIEEMLLSAAVGAVGGVIDPDLGFDIGQDAANVIWGRVDALPEGCVGARVFQIINNESFNTEGKSPRADNIMICEPE